MNCLERDQLFSYAHRLVNQQEAAQLRAHLGECPRCREAVERFERLDAVLEEWKPVEPSAWFDVRIREALRTQLEGSAAWSFWGPRWARSLALVALGIVVIAGVAWLTRSHRPISTPSALVTKPPSQTAAAQTPPAVAKLKPAIVAPGQAKNSPKPAAELKSVVSSVAEGEDARAFDDDDLAAKFDILSELPKRDSGVAD
jgi:anti-sigma factor RsiW